MTKADMGVERFCWTQGFRLPGGAIAPTLLAGSPMITLSIRARPRPPSPARGTLMSVP
jgi:hypothetical protein